MAKLVTIEVTIDPKNPGDPLIEGKNFADNICLKETENLEQALGKVVNRTKKAEGLKNPAQQKLTVGKK